MKSKAILLIKITIVSGLMALMSSCAVTTRSFEGSTETLDNTTDTSTDATSSTSVREEAKPEQTQQVYEYATANFNHLQEEMALGSGEHLTAFAYLLGIKANHVGEFCAFTKEKYSVLFSSESVSARDMVDRLNTELKDHPEWRK